jgi:uncharacterized protein (TIGR01777 family)
VKRIVVSGGTGFIGSHLVKALAARGDEVTVLSRKPELIARQFGASGVRGAGWGSGVGDLASHLSGQDAVVNLAGERAVGVRYTEERKRRIVESRVGTTRAIVEALEAAEPRPASFVSASGAGYYGARAPDLRLDESAPAGDDFLARLCVDWEAAAHGAERHGVRVVILRFGIVLAPDGGALEVMARPFRAFVGGRIGSGQQVVSWLHLEDALAVLLAAIDDERLSGPVNAVSPNGATNAQISREIGRILGRPAWLPAPAFALKALFGEGAEPILTGQRAVPGVLEARGHAWHFAELGPALENCLR